MSATLRLGSKGPDVGRLQNRLNQLVKPRPPLVVDNDFGQKTYSAVKMFQSQQHIGVDGIVGPQTWSALERGAAPGGSPPAGPPTPPTPPGAPGGSTADLREQAVQIAVAENGVREQPLGSNSGPRVSEYLRSTGINGPAYWCMAFVYWSFREASNRAHVPNPMLQTASCTNLYAWARPRGKLITTPQRGDIFLVRGGSDGRTHHHTGLITGLNGSRLATIEGNTNDDGSDNGIGVFARTRSTGGLDFVRI
jgi:peptidoglycan hydrolase-like protein with peptidoglycan-binding domain